MTNLINKKAQGNDSLMPHLLDILSQPASAGLILAGGFGIRIKQASLEDHIKNGETLVQDVPIARATQDLDIFLQMELWMQKGKGKAVREMLDRLGYEALLNYKYLQFGKERNPTTDKFDVKIDLHARVPWEEEKVNYDGRRVGKDTGEMIDGEKDQGVGLHGRTTPEAFAIDDSPTPIQISGHKTNGTKVKVTVLVPHPYASLNMKIKAAHDWLRRVERSEIELKKQSEKHVFDVYLLVAMMRREELDECQSLAERYAGDLIAAEIKRNAIELFEFKDGLGFTEVRRQIGDLLPDYDTFWEALKNALGIIA